MKDIDKELDELIYEVYRQSRLKEQDLEHKPYDQVKTQAIKDIKQLTNQARIDEAERFANAKINHQGRPAIFNPDGLPVSTPLTEEVTRLVNQAAKDRIKELKGE